MRLEQVAELLVAQGVGGWLVGDELPDEGAHGGAGGAGAAVGAQAGAEEVFEFVGAPGGGHVFGAGDTADGGFVQSQFVGNLAQHQWAHGQFALHKEAALAFHDRARDAQDGVEALLDVLDEPARFLQALWQAAGTVALVAAQGAGVAVVQVQARHHVGVEFDHEAAAAAAHHHVGHDGVALHLGKAAPGFGLEPGDDGQARAHAGFVAAAQGAQAFGVAPRQQIQRLVAQRQRGAGGGAVAQFQHLQAQAFGQIACAHAGGVHLLQVGQGAGQELFEFGLLRLALGGGARGAFAGVRWCDEGGGQFGQRLAEVAVVVQGFDQGVQRGLLGGWQAQAQRLLVQVGLQRQRGAVPVGGVAVVGLAVAAAAVHGGGGGVVAPFAVVRGDVHAAVAVPVQLGVAVVFAVVGRGITGAVAVAIAAWVDDGGGRGRIGGDFGGGLAETVAQTDRGVGVRQARGVGLGGVGVAFQKGVVGQLLFHLLCQFQRGELQQPDGLLQLWRQRQVLGGA